MHRKFERFFREPQTGTRLRLEVTSERNDVIESGAFISESSGARYPIVRGVPRFVAFESENYAASFGYQWRRWPKLQFESENVGKPMEGHTRHMWERIVGFHERAHELEGHTLLDIGCGPGRFIDVARSKGASVIGIDYSAAVEVAATNFKGDPDVCICQADALNLPLTSDSIDGAFSIGVLHHTPAPDCAVREAYRVLRPGGWFAVNVYGKGGYYDFPSVQLWRRLFNRLQPTFGHYPALAYTYFTVYAFRRLAFAAPTLGKAIRLAFPFAKLPDFDWSLLDTFDSVTPSYQSAHEPYEVFRWLKDSGYMDMQPSNWACAFTGCKPDASEDRRS
jgi:SAM-dependent methyltransferase